MSTWSNLLAVLKSFADVYADITESFSICLGLRLYFVKQGDRLLSVEIWHVSLPARSRMLDCFCVSLFLGDMYS